MAVPGRSASVASKALAMTIDINTARCDELADHHEPNPQRDALTAAAAVSRASAWGLSPAVEDLRRVGLHFEADELATRARGLDELADTLAPRIA